jgi:hypothetical protein
MFNQNRALTIEDFRKIISKELITKGVVPPLPNSPRELELYQQWLKGWQKLNK